MRKFLIALLTLALAAMPAGAQAPWSYSGLHYIYTGAVFELQEFLGGGWTTAAGASEEHGVWSTSVSAAGGGSITARDDTDGVIRISSGTASLSNSTVSIGSATGTTVRNFSCDQGPAATFHVKSCTLATNGTVSMGFAYDDTTFAVAASQEIGAVFFANSATNSGRWTAAWGDGSSGSTWDSGISASGDVWLRIELLSNSRVRFSVSSTSWFTSFHDVTSNIPDSGEDLALSVHAINVGGNIAATTMDLDAVMVAQRRG